MKKQTVTRKGKTVVCRTIGQEFKSALEAAYTYDLKPHSVYAVLLGRQPSHKGYEFYYEESVPHKIVETKNLHEQLQEALSEVDRLNAELAKAQKKCNHILRKLNKTAK